MQDDGKWLNSSRVQRSAVLDGKIKDFSRSSVLMELIAYVGVDQQRAEFATRAAGPRSLVIACQLLL
jgi:hypothetical protein